MSRIGDAATFSLAMITPQSRVVETRRYLITPTDWYDIARQCINEKKFLILTLCIGYGDNLEYMPTEKQWRNFVHDSTVKLLWLGGNLNNCRVDIINEPTKYVKENGIYSPSKHVWLINIAYDQIGGRLKMGAGCEELNKREAYQYISSHAKFDTLVVHLQGACDTKAKTIDNLNFAQNLAISYNRELDCNEANYKDVSTSKGFEHLKMLVEEAERFGCANFPIVWNDLWEDAFPNNVDKWKFLCFKVNGILRSNYWTEWTGLMDSKAPVPNIENKWEDNDMKIKTIGHKTTDVKTGYGVQLLHELLVYKEYMTDEDIPSVFTYTDKTKLAIEQFQTDLGITVDGRAGRNVWRAFINSITDSVTKGDYRFKLEVVMSPYNDNGDT